MFRFSSLIINFLFFLLGHADGAGRASVYGRVLQDCVCASVNGSLYHEDHHVRGRDEVHHACERVGVTLHRVGGHAYASR